MIFVLPDDDDVHVSNQLALLVAPEITTALPISVARDAEGTATVTLGVRPALRAGQRASLLLGTREAFAEPFADLDTTLAFRVLDAAAGTFLARLRVDGVDSPSLNRLATPPLFLDHWITVT